MSVCDFCSSPDVRWSFGARDFTLLAEKTGLTDERGVPLDWGSLEGFAACDPCKRLIMNTDREALLRRSAQAMVDLFGVHISEALLSCRTVQDAFWANRTSAEPVPASPEDESDPTRRPHD